MIKIISGVYGHYTGGRVVPKDKNDAPFELPSDEEARLVNAGVAEYVGRPAHVTVHVDPSHDEQDQEGEKLISHFEPSDLELMPYNELKKLAKDIGINPIGMKKADLVQAIAEVEVEPGPLYDSEDDVPDLTVADPE